MELVVTETNYKMRGGPRLKLRLILNSTFLLIGTTSARAQYAGDPEPVLFPAESSQLALRVWDPGRYFLIDGNTSFVPGPLNLPPDLPARWELWPSGPISPDQNYGSEGLPMEGNFFFSSQIGNEVGDPHLQELVEGTEIKNHTPFISGSAAYRPVPRLNLWASFYQNDHFSAQTLSNRLAVVNRDDPAWFGENIPSISTIGVGFAAEYGPARLRNQWDAGWLWTTSPLSGRAYPWQGIRTRGEIAFWDRAVLRTAVRRWTSAQGNEAPWNEYGTEALLRDTFHWPHSQLDWEAGSGVRFTHLESNGAIAAIRETTFPLRLQYSLVHHFASQAYTLRSSGSLRFESNSPFAKGELGASKNNAAGNLTLNTSGYVGNAGALSHSITEFLTPDSGVQAVYKADREQSGLFSSLELTQRWKTFSLEASTGLGGDRGLETFATDTVLPMRNSEIRGGRSHSLNQVVWRAEQKLKIQIFPYAWLNIGAALGLSQFPGENSRLDYKPSPYLFQLQMTVQSPSRLHLQAVSNYLGPKEVRRWSNNGSGFTIRRHWEHNINLTQSFLNEKIKLRYTGLHLFGEEVREHPAGNPLRFRILAGADVVF